VEDQAEERYWALQLAVEHLDVDALKGQIRQWAQRVQAVYDCSR
jgi:hypothetical protein